MSSTQQMNAQNPSQRSQKLFLGIQISLRFLAFGLTLAAAWIMFTNKQTSDVYGITVEAKYSYSSAFKFFAVVNVIACVMSFVSLFLTSIYGKKGKNPKYFFPVFVHDLLMVTLLMAGCAAATAIGQVGKYGNSHTGWIAICDHFTKFCNRTTVSVLLSYLALISYLVLAIVSANKSR